VSSVLDKPVVPASATATNRRKLPGGKHATLLWVGIPVVLIAVIAILYWKNSAFRNFVNTRLLKRAPTPVATAPKVSFTLNPPEVRPNSQVTISGAFTDEKGNPIPVITGYYYIYKQDPNTGNKVTYQQGLLGQNVSSFNITVSTKGFIDGKYTVKVSDHVLADVQQVQPTPKYNPLTGSQYASNLVSSGPSLTTVPAIV
jgi:hypothetical protein